MDINNINKYIIPLIQEQCDSFEEDIKIYQNEYDEKIKSVEELYTSQYIKIINLCKDVISLAKKCFRENPVVKGTTKLEYTKYYDETYYLQKVLNSECTLNTHDKEKVEEIKSILKALKLSEDINSVIKEVNNNKEDNTVKDTLNEKQNETKTKILTENNEKIVTSKTEFYTEIDNLKNLRKKLIAFFKSKEINNIPKSEIRSDIKSNKSVGEIRSNYSILENINYENTEIDEIKINPENPSADDVICPSYNEESRIRIVKEIKRNKKETAGGARKGKSRKHLRKQSKKTKKRKASSKKTKRKKSKSGTKKRKKTKRKKRK